MKDFRTLAMKSGDSYEKLVVTDPQNKKNANCKCLIWLTAKSDTSRFKCKGYSYCTY